MSKDNKIRILIITNIATAVISIVALVISIYLYSIKLNIAYVNNSRVLTEYHGVKEGQKLYEEKINIWKINLDTLENEIDRDIKEYQINFAKMTAKERELTEKLINKKQQDYFNYKKAIEEKAQEEDEKLTKAVLGRIDSYILEFGESHQYDYIIGITDAGNLLYARKGPDITDEILTGLNNHYAGE